MRRKKCMVITGVCAYMLISFLSINMLFAQQEAKKEAPKAGEGSVAPAKSSSVISRDVEDYRGEGLRDPFKDYFDTMIPATDGNVIDASAASQTLPPLQVQGVIVSAKLRQAIINDKIVKVGDSIDGVQITTIEKDGVTVFFGNRSYNLSSPAAGTLQELKKKPEGGSDEK